MIRTVYGSSAWQTDPVLDPMHRVSLIGYAGYGEDEVEGTVTFRAEFLNYTEEQWAAWALTNGASFVGYAIAGNYEGMVTKLASMLESTTGTQGIFHLIARHTFSDFMNAVLTASGSGALLTMIVSVLGELVQPSWEKMQSYVADYLDQGGDETPSPEEQARLDAIAACVGAGGTWDEAQAGCVLPQPAVMLQLRIDPRNPRLRQMASRATTDRAKIATAWQATKRETAMVACQNGGGTWDRKYGRCITTEETACVAGGGAWDTKLFVCTGGENQSKTVTERSAAAWYKKPAVVATAAVGGLTLLGLLWWALKAKAVL